MSYTKIISAAVLLACTGGVACGFWNMWAYENTPGLQAVVAPATAGWPAGCPLARTPGMPTLVVALHPNCPCSRATVAELGELMARFPARIAVDVLFVRPAAFTQEWATTDLWKTVAAIPGARAIADDRLIAVKCFGARTSGQVFLFDRDGVRRFEGGITSARGHAGDNIGEEAIETFLNTGFITTHRTPVYGCSLQ